jgi:hypothetical protein
MRRIEGLIAQNVLRQVRPGGGAIFLDPRCPWPSAPCDRHDGPVDPALVYVPGAGSYADTLALGVMAGREGVAPTGAVLRGCLAGLAATFAGS